MGRKISRALITFVGLFVGPGIVALVLGILSGANIDIAVLQPWMLLVYAASALVSGLIFFLLSKPLVTLIFKSAGKADEEIAKLPANAVLPAIIGLILGLVVAVLISSLVSGILTNLLSWLGSVIQVVIYIACGYLGVLILVRHKPGFLEPGFFRRDKDHDKNDESARPKLLDTSVIIDGRIFDICQTGIIEGALIIPEFVLDELRHIADSSDDLKRNRGRRGLDVLKRIQTELDLPVKIVHADVDEAIDVDSKLLALAKDMKGIVVTNDYNLNKVAAVKSVRVFNINELANAVKPVVLPGEEMHVTIVKDGKEQGQGVAYLDDGTMIVVEGGRNELNKPTDVIVTSVLQTAAGRMIFAKIK
ncbi:MAG: PIN domain nuclease [Clostridia bacterium]|jgi:uncharacterized protein YacL|nr:PIN domain nuclease [Clostridia bacterium]MBT7122480.1 PIN domain nuclease [Clostridia bacterium]